jgi:hypothetical protein
MMRWFSMSPLLPPVPPGEFFVRCWFLRHLTSREFTSHADA